ncbi:MULTISPECIES: hypothetical protein [Dyella]|uniref:Uncharacterized protein n=2 Tax=Dyella TaxID=231454 RepID=A0A4R0YRA0_9GAMM|nr:MULTISPECIES: hypothetical protein [Dyella]TBR40595.1 hypothetical protein EYV96_10700 [Dyella terrae]TCI11823.1 hypothetical protein EZM97_00170 [Dyella soli]
MADRIILADYVRPDRRYAIDVDTGLYTRDQSSAYKLSRKGASGFGSEKRLLINGRRRVALVSAYVRDDRWIVRIDGATFVFPDPDKSVLLKRRGLFTWLFQVEDARGKVLEGAYRHIGLGDWPDHGDIFQFIQRSTSSKASTVGFCKVWHRVQSGLSITDPEFISSLTSIP